MLMIIYIIAILTLQQVFSVTLRGWLQSSNYNIIDILLN